MKDFEAFERETNRSDDRLIEIKVIDGKKPVSVTGLVDPRLFTGENKLHLYKDPKDLLWTYKYDHGAVPKVLKQKFTTYTKALETLRVYLNNRNLEITRILD